MVVRIISKAKAVLLPHIRGTSYFEQKWFERTEEDVRRYIPDQDRASRRWLAEKISSAITDLGVESPRILEIGCDLGANLYSLKNILPSRSELVGVDISPASIRSAREFLAGLGATDIVFHIAKADDLTLFEDNSFDVVFTDAVLLYVGDDKIHRVMSEMARVSKKVIFLLELSPDLDTRSSYLSSDGWIRDYRRLIKTENFDCDIKVEPVTEEIRPAGRWPGQGKLIQVTSSNHFC